MNRRTVAAIGPGGFDEVGLERDFICKDQYFQPVGHVRLTRLNSVLAPLGHVWLQLLAG